MAQAKLAKGKKVVTAIAAAGLVLVPLAAAASAAGKPRPAAIAFSFDQISAFTPAGADPRLAATFAAKTPSISDFKFTPAAAKGRPAQIRVAVRAGSVGGSNVTSSIAASTPALAPSSYNLGVAVGWKRFAIAGDVASTASADSAIGKRDSALVGVSYNLKKFSGRVAVAAERGTARVPALAQPDQYMLDVGGAYNISRRVALTGGVRYQVDQNRINPVADQRRDSQAVYVGTAFKF